MSKQKDIWAAVHAVLLAEITFRSGSMPLTIQLGDLDDFVDHLADVVVAKFVVAPRPTE